MSDSVEFITLYPEFDLEYKDDICLWLEHIVGRKKLSIQELTYIFCTDDYLLKKNKDSLDHDFLTDILTFGLSPEGSNYISGDIFISIDRVKENSEKFETSFIDEFHRVIIHGVLHLCGLNDSSEDEKTQMRKEEDLALSLRMF